MEQQTGSKLGKEYVKAVYCNPAHLTSIQREVRWKSPSHPPLCNAMDYTIHGILQARILERVAFLFSRWSSKPRDWTQVSPIAGGFLLAEPQGNPINQGKNWKTSTMSTFNKNTGCREIEICMKASESQLNSEEFLDQDTSRRWKRFSIRSCISHGGVCRS